MATGDAPIKVDAATVLILKPPALVNPGVYSHAFPPTVPCAGYP